jgi:hypothetical protein
MGKTQNTGNLTNAIGQDASNNIGIGGAPSGSFKFEVTGTGRFTGAANALTLRSTSATTMYTEYYYNTSILSGYIGSGSGILSGANNSDFIIRSEADFVVATGGNNRRLTIASTGAATFSSGVGINGATLQTGLGAGLTIEGGSYAPLYLSNSGTLRGFLAAYSGGILLSASTGILSLNNGGGNVLIGTTTDAGFKLDVNGTGRFSGRLQVGSDSIPSISVPSGGDIFMIPNAVILSGLIALGSPYTQNIQIDIVYNNWGSNNVIGLVDMIITLREFGNTGGTAFGKVFATNTGNAATFSTFNTANITTSQCSVTAASGGNYTLRITIDPSNVTDKGSYYLLIPSIAGTGTAVSSITVTYV